MLRISTSEVIGDTVLLHLDGQVIKRWVKLLLRTCEAQLNSGVRVAIDLTNVSFVDREGLALLRKLADRQIEIHNALPFIAEQIKKEVP
jgi:ABC-type transporter Mla MlaB component